MADDLTCNSILVRQGILPVSTTGAKLHSSEDDFTLSIPEGALKPNVQSSVHHGVVRFGPAGPFEFPDGWRAVSPIVYFCFSVDVELTKPAAITLPHCFDCSGSDDFGSLSFLKASDHNYRIENGEKVFRFEPVEPEDEVSFTFSAQYGELHTKHFCYYCIALKHYSQATLASTRLCLVVAKPLRPTTHTSHKLLMLFCLLYDLETCRSVCVEFCVCEYMLLTCHCYSMHLL